MFKIRRGSEIGERELGNGAIFREDESNRRGRIGEIKWRFGDNGKVHEEGEIDLNIN